MYVLLQITYCQKIQVQVRLVKQILNFINTSIFRKRRQLMTKMLSSRLKSMGDLLINIINQYVNMTNPCFKAPLDLYIYFLFKNFAQSFKLLFKVKEVLSGLGYKQLGSRKKGTSQWFMNLLMPYGCDRPRTCP